MKKLIPALFLVIALASCAPTAVPAEPKTISVEYLSNFKTLSIVDENPITGKESIPPYSAHEIKIEVSNPTEYAKIIFSVYNRDGAQDLRIQVATPHEAGVSWSYQDDGSDLTKAIKITDPENTIYYVYVLNRTNSALPYSWSLTASK